MQETKVAVLGAELVSGQTIEGRKEKLFKVLSRHGRVQDPPLYDQV
jgi:hypothetical protein